MTGLFEHDFDDAFDFGHEHFSADDNIFGGHDDIHGGHSEDNIFGGHDNIHDGIHDGHSEENIFGREDYYDSNNHLIARAIDNGLGGEFIYSDHGFEGMLEHGIDGHDTFYGSDGDITHFDIFEAGNASHIMDYDDPLAHIDSYIMPDLLL